FGVTQAYDKHEHPLKPGDTVDAVYGGEHHTFVIESIQEEHGHYFVTGSTTIRVPAPATSKHRQASPPENQAVHTRPVRVREHISFPVAKEKS
ncbi:MAG: hypothetical protein ACRDFX_12465, partial [Chloroflexota bacterium]